MRFKRADGARGPWTPFNEVEPGVYEAATRGQTAIAAGFLVNELIIAINPREAEPEPPQQEDETETEAAPAEDIDPDDPGTENRP